MNHSKYTTDMDNFFHDLNIDYAPCHDIYNKINTDISSFLAAKEYKKLLSLVEHAKAPHFRNSKNTKALFLVISAYADKLSQNTLPAFLEGCQSFEDIIKRYRLTVLFLRRFELLDESDPAFLEAIDNLSSFSPSEDLVSLILSNELFEQKAIIAAYYYNEIFVQSSLAERTKYINMFSEKYPHDYWNIAISNLIKELENAN